MTMLRWSGPEEVPPDWPACVVAVGVFDGVHRGHRDLISWAVEAAARAGLPAVVLTFDPNPAELLAQDDPPTRLATLEHRLRLIGALGVDAVCVMPFTPETAQMSPEDFASEIIAGRLHAATVVVGANFRYGYRARGDVDLLTRSGERAGFSVQPVVLLAQDAGAEPVSSTLVRELVADGKVAAASRALARPHRVEGEVGPGAGRGRDMGYPTANIAPTMLAAVPGDGVYAGRLIIDPYLPAGESGDGPLTLPAAISVGTNPTFDGTVRQVEAFVLDRDDLDLYGRTVAVDFVDRIRDQERFGNAELLIKAMGEDVADTRRILGT